MYTFASLSKTSQMGQIWHPHTLLASTTLLYSLEAYLYCVEYMFILPMSSET